MRIVKHTVKTLSLIYVSLWLLCLVGTAIANSLGMFPTEETGIGSDFAPVVLSILSITGLVFSSLFALSVFTFWSRKNTGPRWLRIITLLFSILSNLLCLVMVTAIDSRIANSISKLGIHLDLLLIFPLATGIVCIAFLIAQLCILLISRNK